MKIQYYFTTSSWQKICICPSRDSLTAAKPISYGFNKYYLGNNSTTPPLYVNENQVNNPAGTFLCADCGDPSSYVIVPWGNLVEWHGGGANVLFVDKHVGWHSKAEMQNLSWWDRD